jgi:hypothetical protein
VVVGGEGALVGRRRDGGGAGSTGRWWGEDVDDVEWWDPGRRRDWVGSGESDLLPAVARWWGGSSAGSGGIRVEPDLLLMTSAADVAS